MKNAPSSHQHPNLYENISTVTAKSATYLGNVGYNQQLPQSALGSRSPLRAMKHWYRMNPELFKKQQYYLTECDMLKNSSKKGLAIEPSTDERKKSLVAVVLPGDNPVDLFLNIICSSKNYDYFLFSPKISNGNKNALLNRGVWFTENFDLFLLNCASCDAAISLGALPHAGHLPVLLAISCLKELGITVIDIQHGLFQWGINFTDNTYKQTYDDSGGLSLPMTTAADIQLTWAKHNPVGYPRCGEEPLAAPLVENVALIATNTNWHIYNPEERVRFARILRGIFERFPEVSFNWKLHPAEYAFKSPIRRLAEAVTRQRTHFHNVNIIEPNTSTLTDAVRKCAFGIATVGTSVIDFEMLQRPCFIYCTRSTESLLKTFTKATKFKSIYELADLMNAGWSERDVPETGQMRPFDASQFEWHIASAVRARKLRGAVNNEIGVALRHMALRRNFDI